MTQREIALLQERLDSSRHYLEFGAGNSTEMAVATTGILTIDTVESSRVFLDECVLNIPAIAKAQASKRLRIHHVDIGVTGEWGKPIDTSGRHLWPSYSSQVFLEDRKWDLVLIDGRFRVACCLNVLLNCDPGIQILIHDFWIRRPYYVLLPFLEVVEKVDTFGLFKPREGIRPSKINSMLKKYRVLDADREEDPVRTKVKRFLHKLAKQ